ncbi:MAG: response regulator [Bacteroidales bacterium]|nr:response regulator [Bacteroidales bacterium]
MFPNYFLRTGILLLLLFAPVILHSQVAESIQNQMKFRHITIDNGLSSNRVISICQDNYGYMWIATFNGLNRYNGIDFRVYYHHAGNPHSLPSNLIFKVFCDSKGRVWIGSRQGLSYYDETIDGFFHLELNDKRQNYSVYDIEEDADHNLWIATYRGIVVYSLEKNEVTGIYAKNSTGISLPSDSVSCIMIDRKENVWFSAFDKGLSFLNLATGEYKHIRQMPDGSGGLPDNRIDDIYEDNSGKIWIATYNGGVSLLDPHSFAITHYNIDQKNPYTERVRVIFEDNANNLFFGTRGGLYAFNRENNTFYLYADSKHRFSQLSHNSILCYYKDKNNGLWLGTHYGGINYADMNRKPFAFFTEFENDQRFLNSNIVFTFAKDSRGNLYIGTEKGLNIYNENTNTFKYLVHDPQNINSPSYNDVKSVALDKDENLWIGTNLGGLDYYSPRTGKFIHYRHKPGDSTSLLSDKVYNVHVDSRNNLWVLTNSNWDDLPSQLSCLESGSGEFKHYKYSFYIGISENARGDLRVGGIGGFWLFDYEKRKFTFVENDSLIGKVYAVYEDTRGNIWTGSNRGLARYNRETNTFADYTYDKGYPFSNVYGILEDNHLNLWISTNSGLVKMTKAVIMPGKIKYQVYDTKDGIQSKEFNYNAYYKAADGMFYFGGINGFNAFYPDIIKDNEFRPDIVISDLLINNQSVPVGIKFNGRVILENPISNTKKIRLRNRDRIFTLRFDALHYSNPEQNSYLYMLSGFDKDYIRANAYNNYVTYTGLPADEYTFKVYGANFDDIRSEQPAELIIKILPPVWRTWWFRIIAFIMLVTASLAYAYLRSAKLRKQKRLLEKAVEERTSELNKSYHELKSHQDELVARNEEIQAQKEEIVQQRDQIHMQNEQLTQSYEKIKILSDFGKKLASTLNLDAINDMIFNYVSSLTDTSVFGIGIYDEKTKSIFFSRLIENNISIPPFSSFLNDSTSCAALCFKNQQIIMSNDYEQEYKNYITELMVRSSSVPKSLIYIPLTVMEKKIGILTVQSYRKNAYTEKDLNTLQSLASYIAIALDNAAAYEIIKNQFQELEKHRNELELLVQERTSDLEKAKEKAEESDRLKSAFLANMSHEIRTPLNAIVGFVNLLSEDQIVEDEKREFYQIIQSNGFTLLNLINDIIDFSKIEAGQMDITLSEIRLDKLFNEIYHIYIEELRRLSQNSKQQVEIKLNTDLLDAVPVLATDYVRLKQIFCNLIHNAIKFTRNGSIEFGIKKLSEDGKVTFYVKDTGIGIDKKNFEIIFERFRKIEDDTMTLYRGTGLGLSITKYLVERLGGEIWLDSEVGKGTEFFFSLPLTVAEKSSSQKVTRITTTGLPIPNWSKSGLLVVEDEGSNFLVIDSMLKKTNIEIFWAKNGEEAIEIFKKNINKINLVLMDIKLPKMDGFEAAKEIKKVKDTVPIIAQTAYALPREEHLIRQENFDDYLSKPIVRDKLIRLMSQYLS